MESKEASQPEHSSAHSPGGKKHTGWRWHCKYFRALCLGINGFAAVRLIFLCAGWCSWPGSSQCGGSGESRWYWGECSQVRICCKNNKVMNYFQANKVRTWPHSWLQLARGGGDHFLPVQGVWGPGEGGAGGQVCHGLEVWDWANDRSHILVNSLRIKYKVIFY